MAPPTGAPILGTLFTAFARQEQGLPYAPSVEALDATEGDLDGECTDLLNRLLSQFGAEVAGNDIVARIDRLKESGVDSRTLDIFRARIRMTQDRHVEAIPILESVMDRFTADKHLHYYLAVSYEEADNFKATEKHLKAYLELNPEDADVLNFLGYLYAEKNVKLHEAEVLIERALVKEPESPYFLDSLGWVYYRQQKAEKAIDAIQEAIYKMPNDDAILRDHLGDAYHLNGQTHKAVQQWRRAYRLDPKLDGVAEKLKAYDKS
jgi:predicted Zn-dependent protease